MSATPAMANKVLTLLSKAFNLAESWGWRPEGTNPCRHVGRYKEESRERYLSDSELRRLGDVLTEADRSWDVAPQAIAAIRLLLVTGCRSSEILNLQWDDVDFERRCLHLHDSKTGKRRRHLFCALRSREAGCDAGMERTRVRRGGHIAAVHSADEPVDSLGQRRSAMSRL